MMSRLEQAVREIATHVYASVGSGFNETIYHRSMEVGLRLRGLRYQSERVVQVVYEQHCVGEGYADLVVGEGDDALIVELKATAGELGRNERQQVRHYMERLGVKKGLLINFQKLGDSKTAVAELKFSDVYPEEEDSEPPAELSQTAVL